ncbi:MAG: 2-phospho-L-lactate guanylyltransferase [Dehalococcoidia bacterium]|nr:2-phospho-L-lactate guanylyltransferase [Dehalococcoidia bacterium]
MPPTVLIPVNRLDRAKGRLADLLASEERAELVRRSLSAVLAAVEGAGMAAVVLTSDEAVEAEVPAGAQVLGEDPELRGLSAQIERAAGELGVDELLILHADLPLVTAEALRDLVAQAPEAPSATLVRPADGGTNAMLLRPPGRFPLAYGRGSGDLHEAAAREAGLAVRRADVPALALDLDTPADVRVLLSTAEGRASQAGRYLVEIGIEGREAFREG